MVYSYAYLFNPQFTQTQNGYDPQFRGACDLYNAGLEAELRALKKQGKFRPGEAISVQVKGQTWDVSIEPAMSLGRLAISIILNSSPTTKFTVCGTRFTRTGWACANRGADAKARQRPRPKSITLPVCASGDCFRALFAG